MDKINQQLRLLLLHSQREQGFASVIALALGLVMLVVGATLLVKSQASQTSVVAQKDATNAASIAEAGVTQYRDFLNNNRILLTYPDCVSRNSSGACPDSGAAAKSWSNLVAANILPVSASTSPSGTCAASGSTNSSNNNTSATTIVNTWANKSGTNWQNADQGQYRLIAYNYTPQGAANTAPGTATLTVEGRTGTNDNAAKSRLQVSFPVTVPATKTPNTGSGFPGFWTKDFYANGTPLVYSDVWDSSGCITGANPVSSSRVTSVPNNPLALAAGMTNDPKGNNGNKILYNLSSTNGTIKPVNQEFPDLPGGNTWAASSETYKNSLDCSSFSGTFPRSGDLDSTGKSFGASTNAPQQNATYIYNCTAGLTTGDSDAHLGVAANNGKETLKFYVNGAFNANANGNILPYQGSGSFTRTAFLVKDAVQINANGNVGNMMDPTAIQIYSYKVDTASRSVNGYQHSLEVSGNGSFYGFFFAPFANLSQKGTGDMSGAVWVKSLDANGNNKVWQGIFDTSRLLISLDSTPSNTMGGISSQNTIQAESSSASTSPSSAQCTVPNYIGTTGANIPSTWNSSGGTITKNVSGTASAASQSPAAGSSVDCATSVAVN